ncbi:oxygen-insensitive NAD(P)H nitroreductase [Acetobacteraceae bacterium]|nr:oxygen-insensitive NAD(P)H nitroreductase [Acetobacteraceae bacterium]
MNIENIVESRYTTKAFDPQKKISNEEILKLKKLLRLTPSSCNLQPWHFIFATSKEGKEKISKSMDRVFPENVDRVMNAALVIVFCTKLKVDENYLTLLFDQEEKDGRFRSHESRIKGQKFRQNYVDNHANQLEWYKQQAYIALGAFLVEAKALGIDACPIGGFSREKLNDLLSLEDKGLTSTVVVSLGHHSEQDFNKHLNKSRLNLDLLFTDI